MATLAQVQQDGQEQDAGRRRELGRVEKDGARGGGMQARESPAVLAHEVGLPAVGAGAEGHQIGVGDAIQAGGEDRARHRRAGRLAVEEGGQALGAGGRATLGALA